MNQVVHEFPDAPFKLVIGGDLPNVRNPKVERLIAASWHATGDILFISDSNVRVEPAFAQQTVLDFEDPNVGCVSNLFTGERGQDTGGLLESLHLLTFVATGSVLAATFNVPCVVGKSMAIRREVLETLSGVLAEDQAIGLAVRRAGYKTILSPVIVRNIVVRRTIRRALARQVRWNKIRFSFSPALYTTEFVLNPLPIGVLSLLGSLARPELMVQQALLVIALITARMLQVVLLAKATSCRVTTRMLIHVPLQDLLQFGAQFVPYVSRQVNWRGHRARLGRGTVMILETDEVLRAA